MPSPGAVIDNREPRLLPAEAARSEELAETPPLPTPMSDPFSFAAPAAESPVAVSERPAAAPKRKMTDYFSPAPRCEPCDEISDPATLCEPCDDQSEPSGAAAPAERPKKQVRKTCYLDGCGSPALKGGRCGKHGGGRRCQHDNCVSLAQSGFDFCKRHGGCRRCQHKNCENSARHRTDFCVRHGGGRRCQHDNCRSSAQGGAGFCIRHGGGRRCQHKDCERSAFDATGFCVRHGGGKRCHHDNCERSAFDATGFCVRHGGGKRCAADTHAGEETPPVALYVFSARVACNGVLRPDLVGEPACTLCIKHLDPSNVEAKHVMSKEYFTLAALLEELVSRGHQSLLGEAVNDCPAGPSRRRMDLSVPTGAPMLLDVEIDEGQHDGYETSCERAKLAGHLIDEGAAHFDKEGIFREGALRRKIYFLRFNPDEFVDEKGNKVGALLQYTKLNGNDASLSLKPTARFLPAVRRLADRVEELIALAQNEAWLEAQPAMQVECMRYNGEAAEK